MRSGLYNARESPTPTELRILNGSFPEGLRGSLFMVGPGRLDINYNVQGELEQTTRSFTFGNLMDALPLLTKISFDPNAKKIPGALYLSDTNQTFLNKFIPRPTYHSMPEGECCSQGIQLFVPLEGSSQTVVCTNHTGALQNIDPTDLRPRSVVEIKEINRAFRCSLSSPHMQYDSDTREHFAVLQDVGFRSTTYSVVAFSEAQPGGYRLATFVAAASVLHSFAVTKDYVIVPVYPYEVPIGSPAYRWGDSLLETLAFDRTRPALFHVISREYRRVHCVYRAPAFFALHQINAVQDADQVSVDCVAYEDDTILRRLRIDSLRKASESFAIPSAQLRRYRLQGITVEAQRYAGASRAAQLPQAQPMVLRSEPAELVCVSPAVSSKPYAFVYGVAHKERLQRAGGSSAYQQPIGSTMYNCIVKLSVADASEAPRVWARKHCYPSEPVFVPRSNREDDGYLVSVFFDSMRITSCLLVLDAATFEEVMIAQLPATVPLSFGHAKFAI
ncbi:carotenoid oxygenase [Coemansia spiralis]|nr:carotenoid oxygenase [Coemansia spiralis]